MLCAGQAALNQAAPTQEEPLSGGLPLHQMNHIQALQAEWERADAEATQAVVVANELEAVALQRRAAAEQACRLAKEAELVSQQAAAWAEQALQLSDQLAKESIAAVAAARNPQPALPTLEAREADVAAQEQALRDSELAVCAREAAAKKREDNLRMREAELEKRTGAANLNLHCDTRAVHEQQNPVSSRLSSFPSSIISQPAASAPAATAPPPTATAAEVHLYSMPYS